MKAGKEPRIDLLAYQREEQLERQGSFKAIAIFGLVLLVFLGGMGFFWWMQNNQISTLKTENKTLQQEIDKLSQTVSGANQGNTIQSKDNRQGMLNKLEEEAQVKSGQLRKIYQLSIPNITVGKLEMKSNNELAVTAYCTSQASFIKFLGQLRELDFINEVKNISSKYDEKTGEVTFNLTLVWEVE